MPDFIICGAMKAGTTALKRMLALHPAIRMPRGESHFFDKEYHQGTSYYDKQFVPDHVTGEKTPYYMSDPRIMMRIRTNYPNVKLIFVLRDPVLRFASQARHDCRVKSNNLPNLNLRQFSEEPVFGPDAYWRGMYACQLTYIWSMFPKGQTHIVFGEQLRQYTTPTLHAIHRFIGVAPRDYEGNPPKADRVIRNKVMEAELADYYRTHNHDLIDLIEDTHIQTWSGMRSYPSLLGR